MEHLTAYIWIAYGGITLLALLLYIPKLIQIFHCDWRPPHKQATKNRRIAVIVPARDESHVIGDLLASVEKQIYDKTCFDVNVIVKDPCDPTVAIAGKAGAKVFVVTQQTCKGEALDGYFQSLTAEQRDGYDAFVIVDADAVLTPDYLSELNNALEQERDIFVTRKFVKNFLGEKKDRSLVCSCAALSYPIIDEMGNLYRTKRGLPVAICGQGLMVRSRVIREIGGWPYRTLTEDYEMTKDSILHDFSSMYYPYAVIYTEEVVRHSDCWKRRLRWVIGYSQCDHRYNGRIRKKFRREKAGFLLRYDTFFSLVPVILFIVATILSSLTGIGLLVYDLSVQNGLWIRALKLAVEPPLLMYAITLWYCFWLLRSYREAFRTIPKGEIFRTALLAPLVLFEYFPIFIQGQLCLLTRKKVGWLKTRRVVYQNGIDDSFRHDSHENR